MRGLLLSLLLSAPLAAGSASTQALEAAAPKSPVLSGAFEQSKTVKGFKKPLKSRGRFTLAQGKGVLWKIEKPFASAVSIDAQGLWQVEAGAKGLTRKPLHRGDMSLALGLVQKLLAGDRSALAQSFDVTELKAPKGAWSLDLAPRDAGLKTALKLVHVEGSKHVERVQYQESNGDSTQLRFSGLSESATVDAADAGAWGG